MFAKQARSLFRGVRMCSSNSNLLKVSVNEKSGVATVSMNSLPVNSLNVELLSALSSTLKDIESNKSRGLILTSESNSVFSAGLDILEMYKPDQERLKLFWTTLQNVWIQLYGSATPTVAAINGHAPAGGCLLAMSCEYRVMLDNLTIGLNETQLGIIAPTWFIASMQNTISRRQTELALTTGRLFKTQEALQVGLVDEIASNKQDALAKSEAFLKRFAKIPPLARAATKRALRAADIEALENNRQNDLDVFVYFINQPKVQQGLGLYLESLKKSRATA